MKEQESPFSHVQKALHIELCVANRVASNYAPALGKSDTQLCAELNPNVDRNKLGFVDAVHLISLHGAKNIVEMIARTIDCTLLPLPNCDGTKQLDLLREVVELSGVVGDLCKNSSEALSPNSDLGGDISYNESQNLIKHLDLLLERVICLKGKLGQ
ncbi:TPA: hypothetical protein QBZ85_001057 [Pasteurella multocida]|nr:hypothetical protein [Pasteurella multocida]HDR0675369.1 hypothetical protein [Pasteurella multocida]HDR0677800.1 hypothetical protein [Pasteurella multocida]HDR0679926.1 hypothetical protein [Pasteurella multocida]HDR0681863.1 hypothetical protein [Pasteurella multocida]